MCRKIWKLTSCLSLPTSKQLLGCEINPMEITDVSWLIWEFLLFLVSFSSTLLLRIDLTLRFVRMFALSYLFLYRSLLSIHSSINLSVPLSIYLYLSISISLCLHKSCKTDKYYSNTVKCCIYPWQHIYPTSLTVKFNKLRVKGVCQGSKSKVSVTGSKCRSW